MIPVLGLPVLNRYELMQRFFNTIDYGPIDRLFVIDNGGALDSSVVKWPTHVNRIHVANLGYNAGVAASWNMIIRGNIDADWWCIASNDITLEPGVLARFVDSMVSDKPTLSRIVMGNERSWGNQFGIFGLNAAFIDTVGWFDENFIPIFWEDTDYMRRIEVVKAHGVELNMPLIDSTTHHDGNMSWKGNIPLSIANERSWAGNVAYYEAKKAAIDKGEWDVVQWTPPSVARIRSQDWPIDRKDNVKDD